MASIIYLPVLLLFLLLVLALPIVIGVYVYKDASRRGMNAVLWTLLAIFAPGFVGLIIYLIVRSGNSDARCHKCGGIIRESFVVCPHCGASLKEHCYNCNGTLEGGWSNCPHCGTPIPEEQKEKMTTTVKSDKGLGRLLLLLIIIPISLCILLALAITFFGFSKSSGHSSSFSYSIETSVEEESENYPFLKDWIASCDAEGTGVYVLEDTDNRLPADTCRFFIYRNDGHYSSYMDVTNTGFFSKKIEAHLTYGTSYEIKYIVQDSKKDDVAPFLSTYTLTVFEYSGDALDALRIFDTNGKEMKYN